MQVNYKFKTKPYAHQVEALDRSVDKESFGFFMEMGTGKSKVLIDTIAYLGSQAINPLDRVEFALIIAPKGVYRNWINKEIPEHFSDEIAHTVQFILENDYVNGRCIEVDGALRHVQRAPWSSA